MTLQEDCDQTDGRGYNADVRMSQRVYNADSDALNTRPTEFFSRPSV